MSLLRSEFFSHTHTLSHSEASASYSRSSQRLKVCVSFCFCSPSLSDLSAPAPCIHCNRGRGCGPLEMTSNSDCIQKKTRAQKSTFPCFLSFSLPVPTELPPFQAHSQQYTSPRLFPDGGIPTTEGFFLLGRRVAMLSPLFRILSCCGREKRE